MRRTFRNFAAVLLSAAVLPALVPGQGLRFKGLLSAWAVGNADGPLRPQLGSRLIPEFSLAVKAGSRVTFDAEASADAYGIAGFLDDGAPEPEGTIRLYRAWARVSTSRFEARAGQTVVAEISARRLNSPLDSTLTLTNAAGRQLAALRRRAGAPASRVLRDPSIALAVGPSPCVVDAVINA